MKFTRVQMLFCSMVLALAAIVSPVAGAMAMDATGDVCDYQAMMAAALGESAYSICDVQRAVANTVSPEAPAPASNVPADPKGTVPAGPRLLVPVLAALAASVSPVTPAPALMPARSLANVDSTFALRTERYLFSLTPHAPPPAL